MKKILKLIKTLAGKSEVYIVGGWIRDAFLGRSNRDLDIACAQNPLALAKKFARAARGRLVVLDNENKVYRVIIKGNPVLECVDFAKMKAQNIESDLMKRDFTVNSIATEIGPDGRINLTKLIDPSLGKPDLKKRVIRSTYPSNFHDDPLRLLRTFRIASELGFKIEPSTLKSVKLNARSITKSAAERVKDEIAKILGAENASQWVTLLESSGLLEAVFPEITPMKRSARRFYFHPNGLWQHSEETLRSLETIMSSLNKYFPDSHEDIAKHLQEPLSSGFNRKTLLKLTALLHDCAKPLCAKKEGKKTRFLGHEKKGAAILEKVFRRLRIGRKETAIAKMIVANHMRPVSLSQAQTISRRASFRLFRDIGENTPDLLLISLADWHSYKRIKTDKPRNLKKQEAALKELVARYFSHKSKEESPKLVDGNVIMKKLRLEPGPVIGHLLRKVSEAQILGKIDTKEQALELAARELTRCAKKYRIKQ